MTVDLPTELILSTLELAAHHHLAVDLAFVARLRLVCRSANRCIRPILFDLVHIDDRNQDQFIALLRDEPPELWAAVRHLAMTWALPPLDLQPKFIAAFQHVRDFSVHRQYLGLLTHTDAIRPSRLFLTTPAGVSSILDHSTALQTVTHLRVVDPSIYSTNWTAYTTALPCLSHLCIDVVGMGSGADKGPKLVKDMAASALRAFPGLERLLFRVHVRSYSIWTEIASSLQTLDDKNIYILRVQRKERDISLAPNHYLWLRLCGADLRAGSGPWSRGQCVSSLKGT